MIVIIEILLAMFLWSKKYISLLMWIVSIMLFQMSFEAGNERIYLEIIEDYPEKDCVKPKKFKFLYKKLNELSNKGIPKEMYYCETMKAYGFILYSLFAVVVVFIDNQLAILCGRTYISFYFVSSLLSALILKKKSFVKRYKNLNRYNIRYLFLPANEPNPRKIGTCRIVSDSKRRGKIFVNVIILETDEVKYNVLFQESNTSEVKSHYTLYEICNVFYIE